MILECIIDGEDVFHIRLFSNIYFKPFSKWKHFSKKNEIFIEN